MGLRPEQWENQAQSPRFTDQFHNFQYDAASGYVSGYSYIGWNLRRPQFEDKRVRQALTMLLDRDLMLETIWYGLGEVVSGPSPIGTEAYDDSIVPWPFDPEGANALLDEAGWVDSDGDGVRDKDGVDLAFDFLMVSGSSEVEQMLTVYQEELKRAGIDMQIRPLEWATFLENIQRREFSAVTLAWAIPPDQDPYQVWHSSQAEAGSNHVGYINPETDKILEKARTTFDKDERYAMYREFHRIIHQDQPYTFLFHRKVLAAVNKRFENVQVYDMGLRPREWWVPKSLQRYP
jgi:peptide/nickel transport system substrate-binding protein